MILIKPKSDSQTNLSVPRTPNEPNLGQNQHKANEDLLDQERLKPG